MPFSSISIVEFEQLNVSWVFLLVSCRNNRLKSLFVTKIVTEKMFFFPPSQHGSDVALVSLLLT